MAREHLSPPHARDDVYYVRAGETLFVPSIMGVLVNDFVDPATGLKRIVEFSSNGGTTMGLTPWFGGSPWFDGKDSGHGNFILGQDGTFSFKARADAVGASDTVTDYITYKISDGYSSSEATISIVVVGHETGIAPSNAPENQMFYVSPQEELTSAYIDAGSGLDTIVFYSSMGRRGSEFEFTKQGDRLMFDVGPYGREVVVDNAERIQFKDGILMFDTDGNAGQAYRLYQAAFEREPDTEGLLYWIGRLDQGDASLIDIADSFLHSPEFVRTFGTEQTVSNASFVDLLYTHTLGRDYDQSGYDYWVGKLDAWETNRADLLAFFSESNENKANVAEAISDGIWLAY